MVRPRQFSLRRLLIIVAALSLSLAAVGFFSHRSKRSQWATQQLAEFCQAKGGYLEQDLVDGDIILHLDETRLSRDEMQLIRGLWSQRAPYSLNSSKDVHLRLNQASLEGNLTELLDDAVVGLHLRGLPIGDETLNVIAGACPRLRALDLSETQITDRSMNTLVKLPLQFVNLRGTTISMAGLKKLRGSHLICLWVDVTDQEAAELALPIDTSPHVPMFH